MPPLLNRRRFLAHSAAATVLALRGIAADRSPSRAVHRPAERCSAPLSLAGNTTRRAPFGWEFGGVPARDQPGALALHWAHAAGAPAAARLRICVLDTREPRTPLAASLLASGRPLGTFDLRWVAEFQVFELPLSAADAAAVQREGVQLRQTEGTQPVWVLTGAGSGPALPVPLRPHLLLDTPTDPLAEFFARLDSLACVQQFGWMAGCVLDGLDDLAALPAHRHLRRSLREYLALWFKPDGRLVYENLRGEPVDNRISGIGSMLPFAALAREQPEHPALGIALRFWHERAAQDPDGCIIDRANTNTEGAYTVGYPLAALARQRRDPKLAELALRQVMVRQQRLFDGRTLFRVHAVGDDGRISRNERNWCRGIAWQFVGLTRTIIALDGLVDLTAAREEAARLARWVMPFQLPNGLWSVFVDEPKLSPDTSGSAGIAAALALCTRHGWMGPEARTAAERCLAGLRPHLTPDGFLGGASQSNKGGAQLQRGDYRVIYPMGMGLMAQLIAALGNVEVGR